MSATYDRIGIGYGLLRKPDLRLATVIDEALGDAQTVEYMPEIRVMEHARFRCLDAVAEALWGATIREFPIPHDFTDGYQPAFWRRPAAYLDPAIRAASSTFATFPGEIVEPAMRRLGGWCESSDSADEPTHRSGPMNPGV